jgi:putative endonuclease
VSEQRALLGRAAETAVVRYLESQGLAIVATNLRVGRLELDIVAREGKVIAVVEVRTRSRRSWTTGFGSIDSRKRQRIRRAGERLWQRRYRQDESVDRLRFDAASVRFEAGQAVVEYVKAAF